MIVSSVVVCSEFDFSVVVCSVFDFSVVVVVVGSLLGGEGVVGNTCLAGFPVSLKLGIKSSETFKYNFVIKVIKFLNIVFLGFFSW